jgi:hypothetical protein
MPDAGRVERSRKPMRQAVASDATVDAVLFGLHGTLIIRPGSPAFWSEGKSPMTSRKS